LITAPRRSPAIPNAAGTHALYTLSTYDLDAHKEIKEIKIINLLDGSNTLISSDSGDKDPQWLGRLNKILYLRSKDNDEAELWISSPGTDSR
jgi:pre-mRNA-splicing helicase BRR2